MRQHQSNYSCQVIRLLTSFLVKDYNITIHKRKSFGYHLTKEMARSFPYVFPSLGYRSSWVANREVITRKFIELISWKWVGWR